MSRTQSLLGASVCRDDSYSAHEPPRFPNITAYKNGWKFLVYVAKDFNVISSIYSTYIYKIFDIRQNIDDFKTSSGHYSA